MSDKNIFNIEAKVAMVGDITYGLRGSGNESSTSTTLNTIAPQHKTIPHITVGLHSFNELPDALGLKNYNGEDNNFLTPWNSVGAVGLDGLFVPYTNAVGTTQSAYLPHFEEPLQIDTASTSKTLDPFNPFGQLTQTDKSHAHTGWFPSGHNISFALSDNPLDPHIGQLYPNRAGAPVDLCFEKDFFARHRAETSGIRSMALRSPLVLSGWGYDTSGNPVPSSGQVPHPQATYNPSLWKTGPVDLRWDFKRKVWTAIPGDKNGLIRVNSLENFNVGTASFVGEVIRGGPLDYANGDIISGIENLMGDRGSVGDMCFVYVDNVDGQRITELVRIEC
jgi:hypothetical protein